MHGSFLVNALSITAHIIVHTHIGGISMRQGIPVHHLNIQGVLYILKANALSLIPAAVIQLAVKEHANPYISRNRGCKGIAGKLDAKISCHAHQEQQCHSKGLD